MDVIGTLLFFIGFLGIIIFIILALISLFNKNQKAKKNFILSGVSFGVLILALIMLPPADDTTTASTTVKSKEEKKREPLTLTMNIYSGDVDHDRKDANISGVTNKDATVTVNGETVEVDDKGKFKKTFSLKDGKNDFTVLATKDGKDKIKNISIKRETEEQLKLRLAAEEVARKEAEAKKKAEGEKEQQAAMSNQDEVDWERKVKEVASSSGTETEKFDLISLYANKYRSTKTQISAFEEDIINEYKNKKYLADITNHEYMLTNIFKSHTIDKYYNNREDIESFAFDFLQNTKYNYRGVEDQNSPSTLANERQMNKALAKMGK